MVNCDVLGKSNMIAALIIPQSRVIEQTVINAEVLSHKPD